ncbi:MAG: hypothetical protein KAS64_11045 [Spirochaetes bacterium]|nr:hypothetical protein [Spirochaetota bacterium]
MKKTLLKYILSFILLSRVTDLSGSDFIKKINVKVLTKTTVKITILLNKPASIILYYDHQRPVNTAKLRSFWFFKIFNLISLKHQVIIKRLTYRQEYYFRVSARTPYSKLSDVMSWKMTFGGNSIIK